MSSIEERVCLRCGMSPENEPLERCVMCGRSYCLDCSYRATGRRFCSVECARQFFYGDSDEDEKLATGEE